MILGCADSARKGARWLPRRSAVRGLFEATRMKLLRTAVIESLGMQENSDVRGGMDA